MEKDYVFPPCEVKDCGKEAVSVSVDTIVEVRPVQDKKGQWWSCCKPKGPTHARCADHPWFVKKEYSPEFLAWQKERREADVKKQSGS